MIRIEPVDGAAMVIAKSQERADPIHPDSIATGVRQRRADRRKSTADNSSPRRLCSGATEMNIPATTYFPRRLPPEYLRR